MTRMVSVVIPALNERALIGGTLRSVTAAFERLPATIGREVILVDNGSDDGTDAAAREACSTVTILHCATRGIAAARNHGARGARGDLLLFLDADTTISPDSIREIVRHRGDRESFAGMVWLSPRDGGWRAWCWWTFWNLVRFLPLSRAKAMPACMFCTRAVFEEFGPFDERVSIGEEWPILARMYRQRRRDFAYLVSISARTSSRRMEMVPLGYTRLFVKWVWAVLDFRGRVHYDHTIRHATVPQDEPPMVAASRTSDRTGNGVACGNHAE
jgi:glycosyltransferase involved in cell wall biosynthesis